MIDLTLYLVTERASLSMKQFFNVIQKAVEGGVTVVQLREKNTPFSEMIAIASELNSLLKPLKIPLIINDRIDVAKEVGAAGVHLGQSDSLIEEARAHLGEQAIIGISIESLDQAKQALLQDPTYLAVSPVFTPKSKLNYSPPLGLAGLKEIAALSPVPVIAIGGITQDNASCIFRAGAQGIAVVSAIFQAQDPKKAAQLLIKERIYAHL